MSFNNMADNWKNCQSFDNVKNIYMIDSKVLAFVTQVVRLGM